MMNPRLAIAATLTIGALLAGCTPEPAPEPSPTPTQVTTTETPTPSPTPTTPSPEPTPTPTAIESFPDDTTGDSPAQAEVRAGWQKFESTIDKYARDPELNDLTEIQHVTTGQEATDSVTGIVRLRENNLKREGDLIMRDTQISEPAANADGVMTSEVSYCFDPTHLRTVDVATGEQGGENAIRPDQTMKVKVLMEQLPDGSWRAALTETELTPC